MFSELKRRCFRLSFCLLLAPTMTMVPMSAVTCQAQDEASADQLIQTWDEKFSAIQELVPKIRQSTDRMERDELLKVYNESVAELDTLRKQMEPVLIQAAAGEGELDGKLHDTLMDLGQLAVSEELYDRGYQLLKPIADRDSEDDTAKQFAAMAAFGSDRFEEAKALIEKIEADGGSRRIRVLQQAKGDMDLRISEWKKEQEIRAAEASSDLPRVKLETTEGDIVIELFEDQAPNAVANFISLIEKGYYDGLTFHRVLPQFMAQGGCPDGTGAGGPGYEIDCECYRSDYRRHFSGTLSMAHAGKNTGGSQFFLTFLATPHLNGKHTAFGRVIEGMDALASLKRVDPNRRNAAMEPSKILKASVVRKRDHAYVPETHPSRRR